MSRLESGKRYRGKMCCKISAPTRQCESEGASNHRKQKSFAQQLARDFPPSRSERDPDGKFLLPRGCPGKQQVRDICTCNQEHEDRCAEEHQQSRTAVAHHSLTPRRHVYAPEVVRMVLLHPL